MIFSKQEIITKLKREICEIFFKKKDGSIRQITPAKQNVIPVWDVEKMAWRSFRVNSVLFVETESRERIEEDVESEDV